MINQSVKLMCVIHVTVLFYVLLAIKITSLLLKMFNVTMEVYFLYIVLFNGHVTAICYFIPSLEIISTL